MEKHMKKNGCIFITESLCCAEYIINQLYFDSKNKYKIPEASKKEINLTNYGQDV